MSWKHLSAFALAVLIIANVIFTILVISEYEKNNYFDQESIDELTELLSRSDIELSPDVMPKKRTDIRVYKSNVTKSGFEAAARVLVGGNLSVREGNMSAVGDNGKYTVTDDFGFSYVARGYEGEAGKYIAVSDKKAAEKTLSTVISFLNIRQIWDIPENRQAVKQPEYKVEKLMVYGGTGALGAHIAEYLDGYKTGNYIDAIVTGDEVKSASGNIMFILPSRAYKAKNTDVFGVMIKEKQRIDALGTNEKHTVVSLGYSLDLCFDVFGAAYLIPVCNVVYSDGTVYTYDIVSGECISE